MNTLALLFALKVSNFCQEKRKREMLQQKKIAIVIVATYAVLFPVAAFLAYKYLGNTNMVYHAPDGSIVRKAELSSAIYFPTQIDTNPIFLLIEQTAQRSLLNESLLQKYTEDLAAACKLGVFNTSVVAFQGYFEKNTVLQYRQKLIGGAQDDLSLITINVANKESITNDFLPLLERYNSHWFASNPLANMSMKTTSVTQIGNDLKDGVLGDLAVIDAISMPLAFAALAYCLRSTRLLMMPACTLPCTILLAFALMYPVSTMLDVSSFAPEMSAAVMMAISIDYCLFMLSRFREQVEMRAQGTALLSDELRWTVVKNTAILTAHNVLISGLTIAVALGGLAFLPISFISTIGIGMSIGAVSAVFVAMTLMPSLLLIFFDFFAVAATCNNPCAKKSALADDGLGNGSIGASESDLLIDGGGSHTSYQARQFMDQMTSNWFRVGQLAYHHPYLTAAAVACLGVPFFYYATLLETDFDMFNQVPRGSAHATTLKTIVEEIGHGSATPFYVTFTSTRDDYGVWTDGRFFELINNVTADIVQRTKQPLDRILSPSMIPSSNGLCPDDSCYIDLFTSQLSYAISSDYRALFNQTVSSNQRAALIALFTVFDPFLAEANDYINHVHDVIELHSNNDLGIEFGILGASADSWAIMRAAMKLFPYQIVITFGIIFCFIAVVFRSVFIPLRMILTVAYTVGLSYGLGVLLFQYDWSHSFWHALSNVHSYTWTVPIFSFSLLCALALDYDVFLITRILENKEQGYNNEAAIAKAVWKTGRIISFAGVIMFIAFGSLMFSNTTMFNEFGAVASFAVLIDTFIIRPVFGPALMSLFGTAAWWPRKFVAPEYERDLSDMAADLPVSYRGGAGSWGFGSVSQLDDVVKVNESPD